MAPAQDCGQLGNSFPGTKAGGDCGCDSLTLASAKRMWRTAPRSSCVAVASRHPFLADDLEVGSPTTRAAWSTDESVAASVLVMATCIADDRVAQGRAESTRLQGVEYREAAVGPAKDNLSVNGHWELRVGGQMISRLADSTSPGGWTAVLRMVG
ncbi:hypothetical protein QMK34_37000 [Amycolatopsis sp. H20-H5]|nr:hypothetical protein [Amycolatopsis sp. H20-H5]MEC3980859.1 hypothetical protein [Amycolatopsis sp. H20-H5]